MSVMWSSWVFKLVIPGSAVRRSLESNVVELGIFKLVILDLQSDDLTREVWSSWVCKLVILVLQSDDLTKVMWSGWVFKLVISASAVRRSQKSNVVELGIQTCNTWVCSQTISREKCGSETIICENRTVCKEKDHLQKCDDFHVRKAAMCTRKCSCLQCELQVQFCMLTPLTKNRLTRLTAQTLQNFKTGYSFKYCIHC